MAVKIQLTPQELLSQSQEMLSLQKEFETLFGQSQTILNQVNENWSANLANNFSGKLLSVQKGFSQITSMLEAGGNLAAESAKSYESVDSLLAKVIGGKEGPLSALSGGAAAAAASVSAGAAAMLMPAGSWKEESLGDLQQSWEDSKNFLKWLDEQYEKLDKGTRNRLEKLMGSRWKNGWKITHDIITGEVSWKTGKAFLKAIGDGSLFDKAVAECLQFFLEDTYMDRGVHYNAGMTEQFKRGNILAGITNISGAIMNNFMWGLVDVTGDLAAGALSALPFMSTIDTVLGTDFANLGEHWHNWSGKVGDYIQSEYDRMAQGIAEFEEKARQTISRVADDVKENVSSTIHRIEEGAKEAGKRVANAAGDAVNSIKDGIGNVIGFFKKKK